MDEAVLSKFGLTGNLQCRDQKAEILLEGYPMVDHVHMLISIRSKYSAVQVVGFIKGKSAINIPRTFLGRKKNSQTTISGPEDTS